MSYVRANKVNLNDALTKANKLVDCISTASSSLSTFKTDAGKAKENWHTDSSIINNWKNNKKGDTNFGSYKKKEGEAEEQWVWTENSIPTAISNAAGKLITDYINKICPTIDSSDYATSVQSSLKQIFDAIQAFEDVGLEVSLESALDEIAKELPDGFSIAVTTTTIDGKEVEIETLVYYDEDTKQYYTIAERVNAFYTYVGITGSGAVAAAAAGTNDDAAMLTFVQTAGETVNTYSTKHFFSVASDSGIAGMYEAAFPGSTYDKEEVHNLYMGAFTNVQENVDTLAANIDDKTNADRFSAMALAGLFAGAYTGINGDALKMEEEKQEENPTEEPSNEPADTPVNNPINNGTPGSGGTGETPEVTPENETPEEEEVHEEYEEQYEEIEEVIEEADENLEDIKEDFEETDTEEIQEENKEVTEEFIDDQAKDDYFDKVNENDGDNSLREEIAEKTESFENRFIENQNNPTDAGTQEIKDELKELGYDDAAIDKIMSGDPTVAKNAFKVGVQDQEMAKIANELAEKAGIEDFDTSYDDSQSYDSLHDGTVNVELTDHDKFIDTLRPESGSNAETPKVVTEYDEYQQAESDFTKAKESYEEIYTETNKSIEAAETAKADLDKYLTDLKEKSGEDPTKWSEDEIKELNKLTTTYNTKVEEANENNEKYLKQYKEYKEARDSFNKEKGEYYDELLDFYQKELGIDKSNNNNNPTPSTPVVKEPDNSNYTDESFIHMINNGNGINWDDANELLNK